MSFIGHRARIVDPISYRADTGELRKIPVGPCLVELFDGNEGCIVWGANGQSSADMLVAAIDEAKGHGSLVLLD